MERLRKEYSLEDKELIEEFLEARRTLSESLVHQSEEINQQPGKLGMAYLIYSLSLHYSLHCIVLCSNLDYDVKMYDIV